MHNPHDHMLDAYIRVLSARKNDVTVVLRYEANADIYQELVSRLGERRVSIFATHRPYVLISWVKIRKNWHEFRQLKFR